MQELVTVKEVVDALGGNRPVAELTGRKYQNAVSNWKSLGTFPRNTFLIMQVALTKQSKRAPSRLWGIPEPNEQK